ncbi:glutamate 5-kinase [soil metagenome]
MIYKKIVIKVGSNVLSGSDGLPDLERIHHMVDQIAKLKQQKVEVILISSGAVAAGKSLISLPEKSDMVASRQLWASVGQVKLMNTYSQYFRDHNLLCAQVLVTKEDFRDRLHYLNMKNCLKALGQNNIIPIINENDVISVTELMFTDNDELAGFVASMMDVEALIILTNVDGIFNGNPGEAGSSLITEMGQDITNFSSFITTKRSNFGRGGMITKSNIAHKVSGLGIQVHIANGKRNNILLEILNGVSHGTRFLPRKKASNRKKWIAHSENYAKGQVFINEGAKTALTSSRASSLLPVGILRIEGEFKKGDIIRLLDETGGAIGLGLAEYGVEKAKEFLGQKNQKPLVHYDYLFLQS